MLVLAKLVGSFIGVLLGVAGVFGIMYLLALAGDPSNYWFFNEFLGIMN